jgi:hypothetical protein
LNRIFIGSHSLSPPLWFTVSVLQGPKQPSNDFDVYLRPLFDELLLLWKKEGVRVWDANKHENFNLRALLFITINNWPALSNLSGHSNKGYWTCSHCLHKIDGVHLKNRKKVVYMGHHRFLPEKHPLRKKGLHWKEKADHRTKPPPILKVRRYLRW